MNMNLNTTSKDILEACSCSSLYFCWPARIDLSLFQEFCMTQWNSPSRADNNLEFQMLCKKEEALKNFCGNLSPFSEQKGSEKLQGTSQIKSLKFLVFPCSCIRLRWNKKFIIRKKIHWNGHQAVRMLWGLGGGSPVVLRITCSGAKNRTDRAKHPYLLSFPLQLTSATPPLSWKFISVLAQGVAVGLRRGSFHSFDLRTIRCTCNSGTAAL